MGSRGNTIILDDLEVDIPRVFLSAVPYFILIISTAGINIQKLMMQKVIIG
ncbi:hypothetical protein [Xanthovirga aplysinae]|uniref:hypothetical protein n=1 Tax=Xanthovirga aplysinae TaxID=2529853 RepID=UPI0012BC9E23|nr:hypothetical protein [Xanthovirga aplysinae]